MENKLRIIELLWHHSKGIHLRELSRLLKTGFPNAVRYANILEKEDVLKKEKEANLIKLKLKDGIRTLAYLKQVNTEEFLKLPKKVQVAVTDFLHELEEKPLIALIFGSYAKNNYTSHSDVDILLVFQKVQNENSIELISKRISMRSNIKLTPIYVDYKSFEKNFLDKNHDFSREIRHDAILLSGIEYFFPLLWRFLA